MPRVNSSALVPVCSVVASYASRFLVISTLAIAIFSAGRQYYLHCENNKAYCKNEMRTLFERNAHFV